MADFDLLEYIKRVYGLEVLLYQQHLLKRKLEQHLYNLKNTRLPTKKPLITFNKMDYIGKPLGYGLACGLSLALLQCLVNIGNNISYWEMLCYIIIYSLVCGGIGGVIGSKYSESAYLEIERKNQIIIEQNTKIEASNTQKKRAIENIYLQINRELDIIKYNISQTEQALEQYYSMDIIYEKYRKKLVAISSFYEYLSSRRCYSLEGPDGAYNIFEMEIRQNIIIQKLDEAIRKLDQIKENQYMLYSAIQDSNNTTMRLYKKIDETSKTMQKIEENTSISEYNTRVTAQNTEFLKWVEFFK